MFVNLIISSYSFLLFFLFIQKNKLISVEARQKLKEAKMNLICLCIAQFLVLVWYTLLPHEACSSFATFYNFLWWYGNGRRCQLFNMACPNINEALRHIQNKVAKNPNCGI